MYFLTVISITLLVSQAFALKYYDCGSRTGQIVEVRLTGCDNDDVCQLKRGESYTCGLTFHSLTESQNLKAYVYGIKDGVTTNYPLPNPNVCETHDIDCPIRMGKIYDLESTLDVKKSYPSVRFDVKFELKDDEGQNVVCGIVPINIV